MSKPDHGLVERRGGTLPKGTMTFEQASALPGLRGKDRRRDLEPVRTGRWLPEGARHWLILYDAEGVRKIGRALESGLGNPYRVRERPGPLVRPASKLAHGPRPGWASSDEIQLALNEHGIDGGEFTPRWLTGRLLALGVPRELRVVTTRGQYVFPLERAIAALCEDRMVLERLDPELRRYRLRAESDRLFLARRKSRPKNDGTS